jgi:hypothetical protein
LTAPRRCNDHPAVLRRKRTLISPEELRGLILLLMNIDDNIEKIRKEVVDGDGEEEH